MQPHSHLARSTRSLSSLALAAILAAVLAAPVAAGPAAVAVATVPQAGSAIAWQSASAWFIPRGALQPVDAPAETYEGTLELFVAEDLAAGHAAYHYTLTTSAGPLQLVFDGEPPAGFVNGAVVRVSGAREGDTVAVDGPVAALDGSSSSTVLVSAPGQGTGVRRLAVVPFNFTNDRSRPFSRSYFNGIVFTNTRSARSYFAEQSKGLVTLEGTTFDWVELDYSNDTCDHRNWALAAKQALADRGVDVTSYSNFVFAFPQTRNCPWRGLGHLPGPNAWINGTPGLRTAVHELGHNFGAHHASTIVCRRDGVRVALSANCSRKEYGDPFTTMGGAERRHDHNLHLAQLGYLPTDATRTITTGGTYGLYHTLSSDGTRVLRIPRGDGTFLYLEYRRPYGTLFDNFSTTDPVVRGLSIRIGGDWTRITQSLLIDTRPGTSTFADAALREGRSFRDYLSRIKITTIDVRKRKVIVKITFPSDTTPPSAPGSFTATGSDAETVRLSWDASTDDRGVAGYRIWRDGQVVATLASTARSFADRGLAPETTYRYAIRAFDAAGNTSPAAADSATTKAIDRPPSSPEASIAELNPQWALVSWTASSDDNGVVAYRVYRDGALFAVTSGTTLEIKVPRDEAGYVVVAVDGAGNLSSPSNEVRLGG